MKPNSADGAKGGDMERRERLERVRAANRRRRGEPVDMLPFEHIELEECPAVRRDFPMHPPPSLVPANLELEPFDIPGFDVVLRDYAGNNIGLMSQFQVLGRMHDGMLVDDLYPGTSSLDSAMQSSQPQSTTDAAAPSMPPASPPTDELPSPANPPPPPLPQPLHSPASDDQLKTSTPLSPSRIVPKKGHQ